MPMSPIGPETIIKKRKEYLMPCSQHFYTHPPQLVKGSMQYLYDHEGKRYVDFYAGVSVMNCGHSNPEIAKATLDQLQTLQHTTTIYLNEPIVNLAERLAQVTPGNLKRSFFCCTGSEANEGALLLARLYTRKERFIAFDSGLHGRTHLTMSATGLKMWRTDPYLKDDFYFVPNVTGIGEAREQKAKASLLAVEQVLEANGATIAAMIVEPIQGNGGILTPPLWYYKALKELLEAHQVLLIVDEVQTGFARTGKMFATEHYGVVPDILTMAKALGNGMPISAFTTTDDIASAFTRPSASTLGGNPVSSQTALAVLDYIERHHLIERAQTLGDLLKEQLMGLKDKYPLIGEVRGLGLMLGAELIEEGEPASDKTDLLIEMMKDQGYIIGKNGVHRNVLAFQPPLVIEVDDIHRMIAALDHSLEILHK